MLFLNKSFKSTVGYCLSSICNWWYQGELGFCCKEAEPCINVYGRVWLYITAAMSLLSFGLITFCISDWTLLEKSSNGSGWRTVLFGERRRPRLRSERKGWTISRKTHHRKNRSVVYYRPQAKFVKVIFIRVSVILFTGSRGGRFPGPYPGGGLRSLARGGTNWDWSPMQLLI